MSDERPCAAAVFVVGDDEDRCALINRSVELAESEFVLALRPGDRLDTKAAEFLVSLAWDCDVTYPSLVWKENEEGPWSLAEAETWCPNRLSLRNFIPDSSLVRRSRWLEVGGLRTGLPYPWWDLWLRLRDAGARFKAVTEAKILTLPGRTPQWSREERESDRNDLLATFYHQATPATTYWRCTLPAKHIPGATQANLPLMNTSEELYTHRGAAVFQFVGSEVHYLTIKFLQSEGIRTLLETDDNYLYWYDNLRQSGWKKTIHEPAPASVEGHRVIAGVVDGVVVSSETLGKEYRKLNRNVHVCPNQIDPEDWPEIVKPDDGIIRIGWFGSRGHAQDSELVAGALEWASGQPNVQVVLMGVGRYRSGRPWFSFPHGWIPFTPDLASYWKMIGLLDIGLAPVRKDRWAGCRSDLKALEYVHAGAVPILSDVPPYFAWKNGINCLKAERASDFKKHLKLLLENVSYRRELLESAQEYVRGERTMADNAWRWREALAA